MIQNANVGEQRSPERSYQLTTLGGLSLRTQQGGVVTSVSPRRLAILAVLAAHGNAGVGRDRLMLLFWPDSTRSRARNALHQAIHAIRTTLGNEAIQTGTLELRLNSEIVRSDVAELRERFAAGEYARAIALYRGPFLDGVYIKDAIEFERWADDERRALAAIHSEALESQYSVTAEALSHRVEPVRDVALPSLPLRGVEPRRRRWASRTGRIGAIAAGGLVIVLGVGAFSWLGRAKAPETMSEEFRVERERLLADRERATRGRVFIETPIVQAQGAVFDSIARDVLEWAHRTIGESKIAHVVPRDTVIGIERAAAEMMGLNNPAIRLSRADARIGVMTVISRQGDSIVVRMSVQRTAPIASSKPTVPWSAFWRRLHIGEPPATSQFPWVESAVSFVRSAPLDKPHSAVLPAVMEVASALDGMRSCDIENHLAPKALPWCWQRENEPMLIQGLREARRKASATRP